MIDVDFIYQRVSDLSRQNKSGQLQNDMFNRMLTSTENILFDYYQDLLEVDGSIAASLVNFIESKEVSVLNGLINLPEDYRHRISVTANIQKKNCAPGTIKLVAFRYAAADEFDMIRQSPIRKGNLERGIAWHTLSSGTIEVSPKVKKVTLRYLRVPQYAERVVEVDVNTLVETYQQDDSSQLEWPVSCQEDIIALMLMQFGITIKETALTQYALSRINSLSNKQLP
jgi:hypothetical protein